MNEIIIPSGWTYFAHRTNTARWKNDPLEMDKINVEKIMSVITEKEEYQELRHYGKYYLHSYTTGNGKPFEIRCLIPSLDYTQTLDVNLKNIILKEFYYDRRNFGGCYGQRHHSIPPKEELIVIGIGEYDEVFNRSNNIIWTIPKRFIDFYKEEIKKGNNRVIELIKSNTKIR